jgi:penicillin-binding protein 1A
VENSNRSSAKASSVAKFVRHAAVFGCGALLIFCLGSLQTFATGLDRVSRELELDTAPQASLVFDRSGRVVFSFASEDRTNVTLDHISRPMVSAVVAAEDRYFFKHAGLDVFGLARAAWVDLRAGAAKQGGSSITQQLVRLVALTRDRTVERKIREALLALRIDRRFQKEQILEAYLNRIYLGDGHYGVEAAARGYFGKSAAELSAAEGATLAGLIKCPSTCSPRVAPAVAKAHRDNVLKNMLAMGTLPTAEYTAAVASPISLVDERHNNYAPAHLDAGRMTKVDGEACALYFMEAVRREVMQRYGSADVLQGGLRIYTTIDMNMQKLAEDSVRARLDQLD